MSKSKEGKKKKRKKVTEAKHEVHLINEII